MKRTLYIFTLVLVFLGCKNNGIHKETSFYIGGYRVSDQIIPYPYLLKENPDSLLLFNSKGILIDKAKYYSIKAMDTLKFNNVHYKVARKSKRKIQVFNLKDTTRFIRYKNGEPIWKYSAKFIKLKSVTIPLSFDEIKARFQGKTLKYNLERDENTPINEDFTIEKVLFFSKSQVTEVTNYLYEKEVVISQKRNFDYFIFEKEGLIFLSFVKDNNNPQPIYQIEKVNNDFILLKDFSSQLKKDKTIKLRSIDDGYSDYNKMLVGIQEYENCFDGYQGEYYYNDDVTYKKGNEYLLDYIKKNAPIDHNHSGYIVVHFNVNCEKIVGDFGLIQMTKDYKKTKFSIDLVKHIVDKVATLTDWPDFSSSNWRYYKDVRAFLMFKIENGKITDLCP